MDTLSPAARSRVMSLIKQRDSKIEQRLRTALWRHGVRYRKNVQIKGTPDIVIGRLRLVIFVDSCFWHGCRHHCRMPKSNVSFWRKKIARNQKRDRFVTRFYRARGWTVLRFWEHTLTKDFEGCVAKVLVYASRSASSRALSSRPKTAE
jgi:DNA mismatch endonuclease (patch repair protein)